MHKNNPFEVQWRKNLQNGLAGIGKAHFFKEVEKVIKSEDLIDWSQKLMKLLYENFKDDEIKEIMYSCACRAPKDNLKHIREEYDQTKDIQHIHNLLQEQFETFIREYKNLKDDQMDFLRKSSWGMAGELEGNVVHAIKIPKDFHNYLKEKDKTKKRFYYCHCPRIRESILLNKSIDPVYCYCGAGFYKDIWEYILGREVNLEIIKSIMKGDDICQIAIYL